MTATATAATLPVTFDESAFEAFLETRDEPMWVTDLRRAAFAVFQEKSGEPLDPVYDFVLNRKPPRAPGEPLTSLGFALAKRYMRWQDAR